MGLVLAFRGFGGERECLTIARIYPTVLYLARQCFQGRILALRKPRPAGKDIEVASEGPSFSRIRTR